MKYRGSDGWMHDDSVEPRRYGHKDNVSGPPQKPQKLYNECPNCGLSISWRKLEGYCERCGWGKSKKAKDDGAGAVACCGLIGASIVAALVGMGMGYGIGGVAGLLVGLGVGLCLPVGLLIAVAISGPTKKENNNGGQTP